MTRTDYSQLGETCYYERLENGLPIYVAVKPEFEKAYAFFAVSYGGMDVRFQLNGEWKDTPAGVAHFLEHKMFDMPDGNALMKLSSAGALPNAFTSLAITAYHFESTTHFYNNLKTLLTFVSTGYFTQESVDKEQGIIGQEIQMVEDNPNWRVFHNLLEGMYHNNPVRISVAGSQQSIAEITAQTLKDCHSAFYHPSNMVLCVAGDVKPEKVIAVARKVLPQEPQELATKYHGEPEPENTVQKHCSEVMEVSAPQFLVGFKAKPHEQGTEGLRQQMLGELAAELLCGDSSPLYAKMYADGLIKGFGVTYEDYPEAAFFAAGGESKDPAKVAQELLKEGERIRRKGIDKERFIRCKRAAYGSRVRALNSFEHCCYQLAQGYFKGYHYYDFPTLYESITLKDVVAFLGELVTEEHMTLSEIRPKAGTAQR